MRPGEVSKICEIQALRVGRPESDRGYMAAMQVSLISIVRWPYWSCHEMM